MSAGQAAATPAAASQPWARENLPGRVAIVTGGANGIGRALVDAALARGMLVLAVDRDAAGLERLAGERAGQALSVSVCDLRQPDAIAMLADDAFARFGAVHLLFNNAGEVTTGPIWRHTPDDLADLFALNVLAVGNAVHHFLPRMLAGGEPGLIVNTASAGGVVTAPGLGAYQATKHAVVGYTESLYRDLAAAGAQVSAAVVCPGAVDTDIMARSNASRAQWADRQGEGGFAAGAAMAAMPPDELAEVVFDRIARGWFWIFPEERTPRDIAKRYADVAQGQVFMGRKPASA